MTQEFSFDMREFNRLPRPEVFPLTNPSPNDLRQAFRFLFKPNRVIALHPREEKYDGTDWGWPLKDPKSRWLIKLSLFPKLKHPLCLAVISREGRFSLWSYRASPADGEKSSGLFRIPLLQQDSSAGNRPSVPDKSLHLYQEERYPGFIEGLVRDFNLLRFAQHCDEEGTLFLRLITPQSEHVIKLDFGGEGSGAPIPCHHMIRIHPSTSLTGFRQTGGWDGGTALFLVEDDAKEHAATLRVGSMRHGTPICLPEPDMEFKLVAAVERKGFLVLGGSEGGLWVRSSLKADFIDINRQKHIRGFVRSLELIPSATAGSPPLILSGSDDFYLYIFDWRGKLLQKAAMGGRVDALLRLENRPAWCDVAVLVRNRGLFCVRLFYDRFRWTETSEKDRKLFVERLWKRIDKEGDSLLIKWLHYPDVSDKLHAVTAILHKPLPQRIDLFAPDLHLLFELNNEVTVYLTHVLQRRIRHIVTSPLPWTDIQQNHLRHYLTLLQHMTEGPFRTRVAVHGLEGWLLMLKKKLSAEPQAAKLLNQLLRKFSDAKRVLQTLAHEAYQSDQRGNTAQAMKKTADFLALAEKLKFERLYSELVLLPDAGTGRVDTVVMQEPGPVFPHQVFFCRGRERLSSYFIQANFSTNEPVPGDCWLHSQRINNAIATVRTLIPINGERLLLVAGRRLGIAEKGRDEIVWHPEMPVPLSSAALYTAGNGNTGPRRLAVTGEWRSGQSQEAVYIFEFEEPDRLRPCKGSLSVPENRGKRIRFSALGWNGKGGLWAVTGGRGDVFYWPDAARAKPGQAMEPGHSASTGSSQHALAVLDDSMVCGGEDGVLRAFDTDGRLLWTNTLPGTIRSITTMSPADNPDGRFSDLAVITDAQHLLLFNRNGEQEGIFQIPGRSLFSMFSRPMKQNGAQHHFIGTLWGEVCLEEEVPKDWEADQYLIFDQKTDGKGLTGKAVQTETEKWDAIRETIRNYTRTITDTPDFLRTWCEPQKSKTIPAYTGWKLNLEEPLLIAWAARRLLASSHKGKYDIVLKMMWATWRQFDAYSTRELRIYIFAGLGSALDEIPKEHHGQVKKLCILVRDGTLAALLLNIPDTVDHNTKLLIEILHIARQKALKEGRPFISAAILQRLRRLPDSFAWILDFFIRGTLKQFESLGSTIHPGFIEGLLAILFQRLDIDRDGILFSLARIPDRHPALARVLTKKPDLRRTFCRWLDRYGIVLFSRNNQCVWTALSREQEKKVMDIPAALAYLRKCFGTDEKMENLADAVALRNFLNLFPGGSTPVKLSQLPEAWQNYVKKTRKFRKGIARIAHHITPVPEVLEWLDKSVQELEELERDTPRPPFVVGLEEAWRQAWVKELSRMRIEVSADERKRPLGAETAAEPIKRFFQAMRDLGFTRGRFYRVIQVPGCYGILKLTYAEGGLRTSDALPIERPLTGVLAEEMQKFCQTEEPRNDKLIYLMRSRNEADLQDEGIIFWDRKVHSNNREPWMEVPVLHRQPQKDYYPIAMFAFDWPEDEDPEEVAKQVGISALTLCRILCDVVRVLALETREREQAWHSQLSELDQRLSREVDTQAIQTALLEAVVKISGAAEGLLTTHESAADELTIRAVTKGLQNFLTDRSLRLTDNVYPVVLAWNSGKALYIPDWRNSDIRTSVLARMDIDWHGPEGSHSYKEWLAKDIRSLLSMPIWSGERIVGAISLHSRQPYSFDSEKVQALEGLLQRTRWFLHAAELDDQRRMWEHAFVHEIRSDMTPVGKGIDEALRNPADAEWSLTQAKRHWRKLLDLSQNFMDIQANPQADKSLVFADTRKIADEFLDLYDEVIKKARQRIEIHPEEPEAEVWQCRLLGSQEVFARAFRNLLDNALKYGKKKAVIRINASSGEGVWQLTISNPGWMSAEEDALKFRAYEKPNQTRHSGAHVGLAASRVWVHAYGGELKLDNMKEEDGTERVRALLRWPLAK
ncbi:MAG: GAF domain-containing sensor histidine kinase [Gammaproteobacteria bacterium]|nr:GAF domain-containing sensor histidine kinase [Gammaproteobacteria bacterium]